MRFLVPPRRPAREALDDVNLSCDEMFRSLQDLAFVNRRWGGSRALERRLVSQMRSSGDSRARLLDVGAGSGEVSRRLAEALRREGFDTAVVAIDLQWRHLAAGRRMFPTETLPGIAGDAFRLPFRTSSFDWAVSTLLLHHFSPEENVLVLKEMSRVARRGFLLLDLRRHLLPLVFVWVAGRLVFRSRASVEDGVTSVRQAYTPEEACRFATSAVPGARVDLVFPFRLLVSGLEG